MRITLKQLDVFVSIAREASVTRAADKLNLTQSATSMALGDLETQLGAKLFDRLGRRLKLNELGSRLLPLAQETVDRALEIESLVHDDDRRLGRLRIGASLSIGNYLMPTLMGQFLQQHPTAELSLDVGNTRHVIESIRQFSCDIGFIEGFCHDPDIDVTHWQDDELVIFAGSQHPLAQQKTVSPDDLKQAWWIMREPGSGTREVFDHAVADKLGSVQVRLELSHTEAIRRAVEAGIGISCASRMTLEDRVAQGHIRILPTPYLNLKRALFIVQHKDKYPTQGLRLLKALCQPTS
jgi:DNA-binding transcriptional LysR family regulator